ncbi:MAG: APC family permease [Gemmataceae bacterium]|nr:APC family permease [Gemmataceae bacterium]
MRADADDRRFGYWAGHLVVMGSMIGAGILTTSGYTLRATGNPQALLALWALGGLLAVCGALTVAELATALPRSGGDYVFVRAAFGPGAGFVSGWATFVLGFAAPTAVIAHLAVSYLTAGVPDRPGWVVPAGATALILAVAVVHTRGARQSAWLQSAATATTAAVLVALGAGGLLVGTGSWDHFRQGGWPTGDQWGPLAAGLIYVGYAYAGWNAAGYLAGEVRDPARTLPRCLVGGAASVIALYLLVNVAYVYALDPAVMTAKSPAEVERVAELAAAALFGPEVAGVVAVALGLTLLASVSAYMLTGPRVAYAMARDGAFPAFAGRLHPTRGTPAAATLTQAALASGMVWAAGSFKDLLDYAAVGLAALAGLTVAAVFPLRRRAGLVHPYRVPLYPLPPLLFLLLTGWTVGYSVVDDGQRAAAALSLLTLLVGVPLAWLVPTRPDSADDR